MNEELPRSGGPQEKIEPRNDINLVLGHGRITTAEPVSKPPPLVLILMVSLVVLLFLGGAVFVGLSTSPPLRTVGKVRPPSPIKTPEPPAPVLTTDETALWATYTNDQNLFSLKYPPEVTLEKRAPDPFPLAVVLRHDDFVVEVGPRAERPGWLLTISEIQDNDKKLTLSDWAKEAKLTLPESTSKITLAGLPALTWRSNVYPESYYLVESLNGVYSLKVAINGPLAEKHQATVDHVLGTLKFLARGEDVNLGLSWRRQVFGTAWDLELPEGWTVNDAGLNQGVLIVSGLLEDKNYALTFDYPSFTDENPPGLPASLDDWLARDLSDLSSEQKLGLIISSLKVGGAEAKEILARPDRKTGEPIHQALIWKRSGRNPSRVVVRQTVGDRDSLRMAKLLERFLVGVR